MFTLNKHLGEYTVGESPLQKVNLHKWEKVLSEGKEMRCQLMSACHLKLLGIHVCN